MKRIFIFLTICASALALASCNKEDISPEYLDKNPSKAAEIRFASKGEFKNTVTMFRESNVYRKSEFEGKITFADKGEDYVIIDFHKVIFDCSFGKYTIDGYLECPLYEQYVSK